jgi:hypothetical protein
MAVVYVWCATRNNISAAPIINGKHIPTIPARIVGMTLVKIHIVHVIKLQIMFVQITTTKIKQIAPKMLILKPVLFF